MGHFPLGNAGLLAKVHSAGLKAECSVEIAAGRVLGETGGGHRESLQPAGEPVKHLSRTVYNKTHHSNWQPEGLVVKSKGQESGLLSSTSWLCYWDLTSPSPFVPQFPPAYSGDYGCDLPAT